MSFLKLCIIDIRLGLYKRIRYVLVLVSTLFSCHMYNVYSENVGQFTIISERNMADLLAFIFKGALPAGSMFSADYEFPLLWVLFIMVFLLMPLDYPYNSMDLWGVLYLVKTGRPAWWCAKIVYVIAAVMKAWIAFIGTIVLYCKAAGISLTFANNMNFYEVLFGEADLNHNYSQRFLPDENILILIIAPFAGMLTLAFIQLFISVWIRPSVAWICSIFLVVLSAFFKSAFLPGNMLMVIRCLYISAGGISPYAELAAGLFYMVVVWVIGLLLIKKRPIIMEKEKV